MDTTMALLDTSGEPDLDISRELAILYRVLNAPRRRRKLPLPAVAALAVAMGWASQASAARTDTYTMGQDETLYEIASRHFGNGMRWTEIASLNNITDPLRVRVGQVIVLPPRTVRAIQPARIAGAISRRAVRRTPAVRQVNWTHDGVQIVPVGEVLLELPAQSRFARRTTGRLARAQAKPVDRVRPQQDTEAAAPLPPPPMHESTSPWSAIEGAAFLLGAFGVAGVLSRNQVKSPVRMLSSEQTHLYLEAFWASVPGSKPLPARA